MDAAPFTLENTTDAPAAFHAAPCSVSLDLRLGDCMDVMATFPDGHFDLAIVDPPYGIGQDVCHTGTKRLKGPMWDKETPPQEYWNELFRVSRNQIVWGGNYFEMPPRRGWIVWDKRPMPPSYASCELAWTSYDRNAATWSGKTGNEVPVADRIHPTQKPVKLYDWLLANYAKPGDRILDTHMGSGSIAIAAHYAGIHLTACEIDPDYYHAALARIERETAQLTLFT
jgi:site-specific DNA-methyltransferase (adenine-specific)